MLAIVPLARNVALIIGVLFVINSATDRSIVGEQKQIEELHQQPLLEPFKVVIMILWITEIKLDGISMRGKRIATVMMLEKSHRLIM